MSKIKVSMDQMRATANAIGNFSNEVAKLDMPAEDFGAWTGGPEDVSRYLAGFCDTMQTSVFQMRPKVIALGEAVATAAAAYAEAEKKNASLGSDLGGMAGKRGGKR